MMVVVAIAALEFAAIRPFWVSDSGMANVVLLIVLSMVNVLAGGILSGAGGRRLTFLYFIMGWLVVFPLGCGIAASSFGTSYTMSGRHLGSYFSPSIFSLSMVPFAITGGATYRYFKERANQRQRYR